VKSANVRVIVLAIIPLLICGVLAVQDKDLKEKFFNLATVLMSGYLALEIPTSATNANRRNTEYHHISKVRPEEMVHHPEKTKGSK
jgi:hypothetical protein